ncbi:MAG: glycoside hydrolase, partial [Acidobacteria bacterium]
MKKIPCLLVAFLAVSSAWAAADILSLDGEWRFELDRKGVGIEQRWFARKLPGRVRLPGTLTGQGIGDEISLDTPWIGTIVDKSFFTAPEYEKYRQPGQIKVPFWLQPDKYYAGNAWYQRDVDIPEEWRGKRVRLSFERAHWETRVWIDGKSYGSNTALATPHEYEIGTTLLPGKHVLTVRVDNRLVVDVGENSHSVSDHTQGNWNGVVGRMELVATPPVWIDDLQVFASERDKSVVVKGRIGNATRQPGRGEVVFSTRRVEPGSPVPSSINVAVTWAPGGGELQAEIPGEFETWDEFNPVLYEITATLLD